MLSLVGKDFRVIALHLCLIVPMFGLAMCSALLVGKVFLFLSCGLAAMLVAASPAMEYGLGADSFVHSLPVSRALVVKARYASSLLLASACLTMMASMAVIFAATVAAHGAVWPAWVALDTALAAVIYVSVFISIFLLCVFRLGMGAGGVVSAVILAVLAPLGIRLVTPADLAALINAVGGILAVAGVILLMALVIWLSMRISIRGYERREF